ncbi:hypothetical protein ALI144C_49095 [Actinosynnema sp. ALI-1.44]|uniref:hypothetical protein n=1 Tax=Actinosynnema sp. ALI-1.44 TaxID=1933779 RepID=UPI00097C1AA4|nr:hypothetical protein [Actinosynnema sp. ALI-1.44]ONI70590.1 hypothetical protein ALI144C_49095 [Actinosynnema sp. ALI-1.44]
MTGRSWPRWSAHAAAGWAAAAAGLGAYRIAGGTTTAGWLIAAGGLVGFLVAVACTRPKPPAAAWLGAFAVAAFALAGGVFTVLTVVAFALTGTVDSWTGAARQALCLLGGILFTATAVAARRRAHGLCPRCAQVHDANEPPPPPVSKGVRRTAIAGAVAFVPYVVMKVLWAIGLRIDGMAGPDLTTSDGLYGFLGRYGIDGTSLAALMGMVLLWALVSQWGQVVPRWLLLAPAWLAALLGPYGVVGMGWVLLALTGAVHSELPVWVVAVGALGFGGFGVAAAVTALSFQRRTRPRCVNPQPLPHREPS